MKEWGVDDHKLPPNETDQVQPIDRGMGRHVKIYLGQQLDAWLEDMTILKNGKTINFLLLTVAFSWHAGMIRQ